MSHFNYKNNILFAERISIPRLAKSYVTPFYCYSLSQIEKNFLTFKKKFKKINPIICFALKANSNLTLLKKLNYMGAGADVVSFINWEAEEIPLKYSKRVPSRIQKIALDVINTVQDNRF